VHAVHQGLWNTAVFTVGLSNDLETERFVLTIGNTGDPFPEEIEPARSGTMGLQLVTILVEQLDGALELRRSPDPLFTIRFPGR
jgi:two-component sensor histidine kinase